MYKLKTFGQIFGLKVRGVNKYARHKICFAGGQAMHSVMLSCCL